MSKSYSSLSGLYSKTISAGTQGFDATLTDVNIIVSNVSIYSTNICINSGLAGKDSFTYIYASHATRDTIDYLIHLRLADRMKDFWATSTILAGWVQLETNQSLPAFTFTKGICYSAIEDYPRGRLCGKLSNGNRHWSNKHGQIL